MKFMVGYDGSNVGKEALNQAIKHAGAFNGKVYVVSSLTGGSSEQSARKVEAAEQDMAYAENVCRKSGVAYETHLLIRGLTPGEDLIRFADENDIDEIIVGVQRRSKVGKMIFGSTSLYVIQEAQCPVLTVK